MLAVSTEFPASVSADSVLTVSRAMKFGLGPLSALFITIILYMYMYVRHQTVWYITSLWLNGFVKEQTRPHYPMIDCNNQVSEYKIKSQNIQRSDGFWSDGKHVLARPGLMLHIGQGDLCCLLPWCPLRFVP